MILLILGLIFLIVGLFSLFVFLCRASSNWFHAPFFLNAWLNDYYSMDTSKFKSWLKYGGNGSWNDRIIPWLVLTIINFVLSSILILLCFL